MQPYPIPDFISTTVAGGYRPCVLLVLVLLLGSGTAACGGDESDRQSAENPVDSLAVSATDSIGARLDSAASGIIDTASVASDSVQVPVTTNSPVSGEPRVEMADTLVMERLLSEVAALRTEVAKLTAGSTIQKRSSADTSQTSTRARVKETAEDVQNFGLRAFWAVIIIAAAFFLIKAIVWLLETLSERSARRRLFFKKLIPITRILVWIVVVYYIISGVFEVDQDGLLAAGAAVGVAVGFAAQDVLKNIFGGILIILDQPFQVGDRVSVGGTYGEVVSIGLRSTRIVTPDDNLVSVPNTQVVDGQVANANAGALDCQVVTELYLPGWVDVSKAKEIAYDAAANSKFVYLKKPIVVLIKDEFKETFLTRVVIKAYVIDARYEARFASDVTETAKMQYLREGMLAEFYPGAAAIADGETSHELG
ncbi:MAG: mechanosensitive ion channel family protein [Rhodothermia bacterium]|nr:mechanosensitive ion channel family protein [Rhodothermia bacterium]